MSRTAHRLGEQSVSGLLSKALRQTETVVLGREKSPLERGIFHRISLMAFFAWVGLGADGLSSSCYGPEEAYLALHGATHLAIWLALATALTVAVIAASYTQIIELFPGGGGGYIVATRLLSAKAGVISGCALVVDYVLTIAVSVVSGVDAVLSFTSHADSPWKPALALLVIGGLVLLNLRGVKESIRFLLPIFLLFVATHAVLIAGTFGLHVTALPTVVRESVAGTRDSFTTIGFWATLFLFLRAFSLGAGTYTGIEAVSNGLPVLREPRVRTGRRTMFYMAASLALTAGGILVAYRLLHLEHEPGRTLNASLLHRFADAWNGGPLPWGALFVGAALLAEGMLLFVAAQTGFVDGPRVLASMAIDRWVPSRFANMSSRLVTANGVVLMAAAAGLAIIYTRAQIRHLVIMYSINVFVTFTLSQLGMVRHWWQVRREPGASGARTWLPRLFLNGAGMSICLLILGVTVALKFHQGGWVTLLVTGSLVAAAFLVRRHYRRVGAAVATLNLLGPDLDRVEYEAGPGDAIAVFVQRYDGFGLHTFSRARALVGPRLRKVVFLSVVQVDADQFRNEEHIEKLNHARRADLDRYLATARDAGLEAEGHYRVGTDVVEELERMAVETAARMPGILFVAGQIVFERESFVTRLLHNEVAFLLQKRLIFRGLQAIVLPMTVPGDEGA